VLPRLVRSIGPAKGASCCIPPFGELGPRNIVRGKFKYLTGESRRTTATASSEKQRTDHVTSNPSCPLHRDSASALHYKETMPALRETTNLRRPKSPRAFPVKHRGRSKGAPSLSKTRRPSSESNENSIGAREGHCQTRSYQLANSRSEKQLN